MGHIIWNKNRSQHHFKLHTSRHFSIYNEHFRSHFLLENRRLLADDVAFRNLNKTWQKRKTQLASNIDSKADICVTQGASDYCLMERKRRIFCLSEQNSNLLHPGYKTTDIPKGRSAFNIVQCRVTCISLTSQLTIIWSRSVGEITFNNIHKIKNRQNLMGHNTEHANEGMIN